ncbi:MAG: hypothetical protein J6X48_02740, partial [Lachnospiraceae bacterium]|nr:hypothetical protein [Lachnospiraceae bacterium]
FISIPKLGYFRNEEIGFSIDKLKYTLHILWTQDDESIWNSTSQFGIFYHFTRFLLPFGIIGLIVKRNKKSIPILMWLLISFVHSTMVDANFTRINTLFIPILFVIATGIAFIVSLFGEKLGKIAAVGVVACYLFSLTVFSRYYCTDYNKVMAEVWFDRFYDALEKASFSGGIIHVMYGDASYPLILYYSEYPVEKFVDSVVYWDESAPFLHPTSFDGYTLTDFTDEEPVSGEAYICYKGHAEALEYLQAHGMECEEFGNYVVGEMP